MKADYVFAGMLLVGATLIIAGVQVLAGLGWSLITLGGMIFFFALIVLRGLTNA